MGRSSANAEGFVPPFVNVPLEGARRSRLQSRAESELREQRQRRPGPGVRRHRNITQLDKVMFGNPPRALQADRREHRRGARAQRGSCCGDAADDARPRDPARPRTSRRHRRGGKREATEAAACTAPRKSPSPTPSPRAARRQCAGSSATSSTTKRRRRPTGEGRCGPCAPWTAVPLISCSPSSRSFWVLGGLHGRLGRE